MTTLPDLKIENDWPLNKNRVNTRRYPSPTKDLFSILFLAIGKILFYQFDLQVQQSTSFFVKWHFEALGGGLAPLFEWRGLKQPLGLPENPGSDEKMMFPYHVVS